MLLHDYSNYESKTNDDIELAILNIYLAKEIEEDDMSSGSWDLNTSNISLASNFSNSWSDSPDFKLDTTNNILYEEGYL